MAMFLAQLLLQASKTLSLVIFYYFFSISLTFYNKWILMGYPFPLTLTMIHLITKFLLAWIIRKGQSLCCRRQPVVLSWTDYVKCIMPVALFSALDIGLSNWSLLFITVSLYTMSKSTALIFILLFSILFRLEQPRVLLIAVVVMIVSGLFMFTYQSTSFDMTGFILVISASVITGLRWSTAQLTLQKEELGLSNPIDTVFHLQPVMIITLLPLAIPVDGTIVGTSVLVFRASTWNDLGWTTAYILPAALLAFMLGVSEYLLVYHTSGLTLSVSGVFKEILILTISTMWWDEDRLSTINILGMVVCICGITLHVILKAIRARQEEAEKALNRERGDTEELMPSSSSKSMKSKRGGGGGGNNHHHHYLHGSNGGKFSKHDGRLLSTVEEEESSNSGSDDSVVVYDTSRV